MQYLTKVRVSGSKAIEFTFESESQIEADRAYNEIVYQFNGLGYFSPTIKDGHGNILAVLIGQENVVVDVVITESFLRRLYNKILKWWRS